MVEGENICATVVALRSGAYSLLPVRMKGPVCTHLRRHIDVSHDEPKYSAFSFFDNAGFVEIICVSAIWADASFASRHVSVERVLHLS